MCKSYSGFPYNQLDGLDGGGQFCGGESVDCVVSRFDSKGGLKDYNIFLVISSTRPLM